MSTRGALWLGSESSGLSANFNVCEELGDAGCVGLDRLCGSNCVGGVADRLVGDVRGWRWRRHDRGRLVEIGCGGGDFGMREVVDLRVR